MTNWVFVLLDEVKGLIGKRHTVGNDKFNFEERPEFDITTEGRKDIADALTNNLSPKVKRVDL